MFFRDYIPTYGGQRTLNFVKFLGFMLVFIGYLMILSVKKEHLAMKNRDAGAEPLRQPGLKHVETMYNHQICIKIYPTSRVALETKVVPP
jgi:hypothetical protein